MLMLQVLALVCRRTVAQGCNKETQGETRLGKKGWGQFVYPKWFSARVWAKPLVIPEVRMFPKRDSRDYGVTCLAPVLLAPRRFRKVQQRLSLFLIVFHPLCFLCEALAKVWVRRSLGRRAVARIPLVGARWRRGIMLQPCTWLFWGKPSAQVTPGQFLCLQEDKPRATGASLSWRPPERPASAGHQQGLSWNCAATKGARILGGCQDLSQCELCARSNGGL